MKQYIFITLYFLMSVFSFGQSAEITGRITDEENNEPIPFANIIVVGTQIGSTSDFDGNFTITGIKPGYIQLQASFVGYKTQKTTDILITNNNIPFIEINLEAKEEMLSEVEITSDIFIKRIESPLSMQIIGTKEIENNPGSNRDISRVIQSFPGVGSTPAYRNDVIIRGGGPGENRFYLDDVEIPVLNHFSTQGASGGPVGIINADFIQFVNFYSGSFPTTKYNTLSGILDFKQKEGSKDKTNLQVTLGASEAALTLDGPIGDKSTYIFSIRRSYLQFLFSALGLPFLPTFNDYQFKLKTNIDNKNQFTIISIGSLDNLSLNNNIKNPDASQEYLLSQIPINNQWSYTFGTVYKHFFKHGHHTVVISRNMLNNEFYKYPDNDESLDKSFDYLSIEEENRFRYEFTLRNKGIKYNFGANLEYAQYFNETTQQIFINDSLTKYSYSTNLNLLKYGLAAQASKSLLKNRLKASIGVRVDANNYNSNTSNLLNQLSPRLSLSYSLAKKTKLNGGLGRYYQRAAYTTLGFRNNSAELVNSSSAKYIGVDHYNLGLEHRFSKAIILSAEAFYKDYFQYPIDLLTGASLANQGADYSSIAGAAAVDFKGTGHAIGFEILNRINYKKINLLAAYTYVRSEFTDINNKLIPSSWDSKHLLTITSTKEFKRNWRIGLKWRYVGGLPYTPYDLDKSASIEAWSAIGQPYLDYDELNTLRFQSFHQLDVRIDKNYFFEKWTIMLYVDIQNLYNFKNKGQDFIIREKNPNGSFKTVNNETEYVLTSIENISGTILPSIGIMLKF